MENETEKAVEWYRNQIKELIQKIDNEVYLQGIYSMLKAEAGD